MRVYRNKSEGEDARGLDRAQRQTQTPDAFPRTRIDRQLFDIVPRSGRKPRRTQTLAYNTQLRRLYQNGQYRSGLSVRPSSFSKGLPWAPDLRPRQATGCDRPRSPSWSEPCPGPPDGAALCTAGPAHWRSAGWLTDLITRHATHTGRSREGLYHSRTRSPRACICATA